MAEQNSPEVENTEKKGKGGRPRIPIDKEIFEYLLSCGCSLRMIAGYFALTQGSCSEDTIERFCKRTYHQKFADVQALYREGGRTQILMKQMEVAMKGDVKMLIWLGKVKCGQSENTPAKPAQETTSKLYEVLEKTESLPDPDEAPEEKSAENAG